MAFLTKRPVAACGGLSLMVGVAACAVLSPLGAVLRLKWPNDLLDTHGRKVGGVLIEVAQREGETLVLVGIGINVGNSICCAGGERVYTPGHLIVSSPYNEAPFQLAPLVAQAIREHWVTFESEGLGPFVDEWRGRCSHMDVTIEVQTDEGAKRGICRGVDADGALLIEIDGSRQRIVSGHVSYLG